MAHERSKLRAYVIERSGHRCEWPCCRDAGAHMAHIAGIGMGGRGSADTPGNVAFLCIPHHDQFDGRSPYLGSSWRDLLTVMPSPLDDAVCCWPGCSSDVFEVGLCYEHTMFTDASKPRPGRKQAAAALLSHHVARLRVRNGESVA